MKILTIGAGVIGVTYSWQLQKAGFNITHLVRPDKREFYEKHGIIIRCYDLRPTSKEYCMELYRPGFVEEFSTNDCYHYILVSVNSHQLIEVLPSLRENSGNATIIFLQNMKFGDDEILDQYLDNAQYVTCYPFNAGGGRKRNNIDTIISGSYLSQTVMGEKDGTITDRTKRIYSLFKKGDMNPKIITNIIPYIRSQYIWAACSVAAYMKAGTYEQFIMHESLKELSMAMKEGWEICRTQGIHPGIVEPPCCYGLPSFTLLPLTQWFYNKAGIKEMFEGRIKHALHEIRDMYYSLLHEKKKYGITMPVYEGYEASVSAYCREWAEENDYDCK